MSDDAENRANRRRQTWRGEIKRGGEDHFTATSSIGPTLPLHRLAQTPEEMGQNILHLEQLRRLLYADFGAPMQKTVVKITRKPT
ncbi:MAG: hypothetical protein HYR96_06180 [Deltaproteobacteria bacterium]|nr:hypothetical protein [Deltaproteobacteria bacterium]MBI3295284.1 hypothetical protein [Deltaproteobacteria bacterium]